jgi:glycosyltransferase involved in cell wall biosynthesis
LIKTINVSKKKFDIVHLNDSNLIIITPLIKFFFRCKILCHIRTRIASRIQIPNFILNFSKKYVDSFISIDQSTFATSIEPTKTKVIYNIFPLHKLKKNNKSKNLIIGFLGTLDFHKGLDFLFNTIQYINQKKNNFIFLIAGGLSVQSNFILKILSFFKIKKNFNSVFKSFNNNKYKNVLFLGEIIDIEKFYEKIDIIVFPSRMNALGRPVLEAASYGIPSIVCLRSYYNDTFIKNKTGFIVKFSDKLNFKKKLIFLHKNKKLIKTMGLNARNNFKKIHLPKTNIKNLKTIYENL